MSNAKNRWFVVASGDAVRELFQKNFPDAPYFEALRILRPGTSDEYEKQKGFELSFDDLQKFHALLKNEGRSGTLCVLRGVNDQDLQYAQLREFDPSARSQSRVNAQTKKAIKWRES